MDSPKGPEIRNLQRTAHAIAGAIQARCAECGDTFTPTEWELRHTRGDGEDIHERCCDHCGEAS